MFSFRSPPNNQSGVCVCVCVSVSFFGLVAIFVCATEQNQKIHLTLQKVRWNETAAWLRHHVGVLLLGHVAGEMRLRGVFVYVKLSNRDSTLEQSPPKISLSHECWKFRSHIIIYCNSKLYYLSARPPSGVYGNIKYFIKGYIPVYLGVNESGAGVKKKWCHHDM